MDEQKKLMADLLFSSTNMATMTSRENHLHDLDLFNCNIAFDTNQIDNDASMSQCVGRRYFSPHSLKQFSCNLSKYQIESGLSIFHNNITSLNRNLDDLVTHYLHELGFHFNIIGVTETKINNSNQNTGLTNIPGYDFEHVPMPLACEGVGLFVDETLNYSVLEKVSTESFQALWIEISFVNPKNVICGIMHRQHNSPESFLKYMEEATVKFCSTGKSLCLLGHFNICLRKFETYNYSRDFLLTLKSCYLLRTIDKPTRVHANTARLIDNIFANNPEKVLIRW